MKKLLLAAIIAGSALSGPVLAQDRGGPMRIDTNGDGMVSRAEFMAAAADRFKRLDANSDMKLSGEELQGPRGGAMMAADTNHDGTVTFAEYNAEAADRFAKLDTNHDGQLTPEEMAAMRGMRGGPRGPGGRGGPGGPDGPGRADGGMMPPPGGPGHMHGDPMKADTNHDGKISRDEMRAAADAKFAKLDTNRDGYVDAAEMAGAHGKHHRPGGMPGGDMPPPPPPGQ